MALSDTQKSLMRLMVVHTRPNTDQLAAWAVMSDEDIGNTIATWAAAEKANASISVGFYNQLVALGV